MRRKRSSPGLTEHLLQVEVLLGHVWQIHRLILQRNTRHRVTSRHKTRRITLVAPCRDGILAPIDSGVVPGEPGMAQHHRGHRWVSNKKLHSLRMIARRDECNWYGGVSDVGKWLSIECTDRDLVAEWDGWESWAGGQRLGPWDSPLLPNPATPNRHVFRLPIAVLPGGEWCLRIGPVILHPTVTSCLLPGLRFYWAPVQEVPRRTTVQTQSSSSSTLSLHPGKPSSTNLHGFAVGQVADRTSRFDRGMIGNNGWPWLMTSSLVTLP